MNQQEIDEIAHRLSQQWTDLIRLRVSQKNNLQSNSFLNQLEANGRIVFKYEDQKLLVKNKSFSENIKTKCAHNRKKLWTLYLFKNCMKWQRQNWRKETEKDHWKIRSFCACYTGLKTIFLLGWIMHLAIIVKV